MDYEMNFISEKDYLHVIVTGTNTVENVLAFLDELLGKIRDLGVAYVLVDERLEGPRLTMTEVFEVASKTSERSLGIGLRAMAYVDVQAGDEMMKFAELVATNRSMPIRVFTSMTNAKTWLVEKIAAGGMQK